MGRVCRSIAEQGQEDGASFSTPNPHALPSQVLHCQLSAEEVMFPVSVTQQSPAAVSMETYHVTLTLPPTQVEGVGNGVGQQVVQWPPPFQLCSFLRGDGEGE